MGYPYTGWQQPNIYNQPPFGGYGQQIQPQMNAQPAQQIGGQNPFTMVPTIADVEKVVAQPGETKWIMCRTTQCSRSRRPTQWVMHPASITG